MIVFRLILDDLRQHRLSSVLACASIAVAIALFVSTVSLREQARDNFMRSGSGIDAVLGPKGSPLQIALCAMYNLGEMPGMIKWSYYKEIASDPLVEAAFPFCTGHSFRGFPVVAIAPEFFEKFHNGRGKKFRFGAGRGGIFKGTDEAVIGSAAAAELAIGVGDSFNPVCGVNQGESAHREKIRVAGVLAPTGEAFDKAIYIRLDRFYDLSGHTGEVAAMARDESTREVSGAFIVLKHIREKTLHPGIRGLKNRVDRSIQAQLVVPNEVMPGLFEIFGWIDAVLLSMALIAGTLSAMYLFTVLLNETSSRLRDIALLRFLGASRKTVMSVVLGRSLLLTAAGSAAGYFAGHVIVSFAAGVIAERTGLQFSAVFVSSGELMILPAIIVIGVLAGIIPALKCYRADILKNLRPLS